MKKFIVLVLGAAFPFLGWYLVFLLKRKEELLFLSAVASGLTMLFIALSNQLKKYFKVMFGYYWFFADTIIFCILGVLIGQIINEDMTSAILLTFTLSCLFSGILLNRRIKKSIMLDMGGEEIKKDTKLLRAIRGNPFKLTSIDRWEVIERGNFQGYLCVSTSTDEWFVLKPKDLLID